LPNITEEKTVVLGDWCKTISMDVDDMPQNAFSVERIKMMKETVPISLILHPIEVRTWMVNATMEVWANVSYDGREERDKQMWFQSILIGRVFESSVNQIVEGRLRPILFINFNGWGACDLRGVFQTGSVLMLNF
jgi:hypothetical protein